MSEIDELEIADDELEVADAPAAPIEVAKISEPPGGWGYQSLLIRQIRRDGGTQARIGLNEDTVQEYAELMREHRWDLRSMQRPIVLYDGADFWLADGFHRIEAAQRAQLSDFPVEILRGTQRDAILRAAGANSQHGLRRTRLDVQRAIELLLNDEEWRQWSNVKIAAQVGCSDKTVAEVRRRMEAASEIPSLTIRQGADGKSYPVAPTAPKPSAPADITDDERRIAAAAGYVWEGSDLIPGKQAVYHFSSTSGVIDGATMTRPQFDAWLKIHTPPPVRYQQLPPPIEMPIPRDSEDAADDAAMIADIRALAEPLGLLMLWEDNRVVLYWPDEADDIEQMDMLSYGAALEWLKWEAVGIKADRDDAAQTDPAYVAAIDEQIEAGDREPQLMPTLTELDTSDRAAYAAKEERDAGRLLRARTLIGNGEVDAARVVLSQIEVSTYARDQVLATIPAGREITLELTFDECAALLKEARMFSGTELTKRLPTIGQALILMVQAIKGVA